VSYIAVHLVFVFFYIEKFYFLVDAESGGILQRFQALLVVSVYIYGDVFRGYLSVSTCFVVPNGRSCSIQFLFYVVVLE
jgi:hypothetical protein